MTNHRISLQVNGDDLTIDVEPRTLLVDALRSECRLLGTHVACEQGACGSCTVLLDGRSVRSCLLFAIQVEGAAITTIESVGSPDNLHPLQEALMQNHGLQCGFCTAGVVMSALELVNSFEAPTRREIEAWLSGNLCRCTGYSGIVDAIEMCISSRAAMVEKS